jgi:hypothetical protein
VHRESGWITVAQLLAGEFLFARPLERTQQPEPDMRQKIHARRGP